MKENGKSLPNMAGRKINMATKKTAYEAPTPATDKRKALETALSQIEKSYGNKQYYPGYKNRDNHYFAAFIFKIHTFPPKTL